MAAVSATTAGANAGASKGEAPVRYGPLDCDLKPKDQLRPLLPTWNPPPTRRPTPETLEVSTRLRFLLEDRWWAATIREAKDDEVKVAYDGWPSRHDEWVKRDSNRLYLHESTHPEYEPPPVPQRFQRKAPTDEEGNELPLPVRQPRPKVYDPEKERLKRALRPPLPYNPEKERLKRLLRGQHTPPIINDHSHERDVTTQELKAAGFPTGDTLPEKEAAGSSPRAQNVGVGDPVASESTSSVAGQDHQQRAETVQHAAPVPPKQPVPTPTTSVEWEEVPGGVGGTRAFKSVATGEVSTSQPPSGWVALLAEGNATYYWNVTTQATQWERPQ